MNFRDLLWASLAPGPVPKPTSLIISRHLAILGNLVGGQGLEFQPYDDPSGQRLGCLKKIVKQTGIVGYVPDILNKTIGTGEVLIWLRLTEKGYRIRYYHYDEFVPYFKPDSDDLMAAIICYSVYKGDSLKKYRVLVDQSGYYTTEDKNQGTIFNGEPNSGGLWDQIDESKYTFNPHPVPFFPLYLIRNKPTGPGHRAMHDFVGLEDDICYHHRVHRTVSSNVRKFARQTILTNLKQTDLFKEETDKYTSSASYRAGFRAITPEATPEKEIAEYIGVDGLPGETFVQPINWNPINSDQLTYLERWSEQLFESLSSISKIGGNTAYETRAMIAIPLAAANRKSELLFTQGICEMLADCLTYESLLFRCPDAMDRSISWRRIELVEPSTRDQLDVSILTRNLSEQGVGDSELLKLQFPGRTEEDIKRITGGAGGIPYRKIDKTVPAVQQLLDLAGTVVDTEIQIRLYGLAASLVRSLEDSLNYGRPEQQSDPYAPGLPYESFQSPEPEPLGTIGSGMADLGSTGNGLGSPDPASPGSNPTSPANPLRDFFRGFWRGSRKPGN